MKRTHFEESLNANLLSHFTSELALRRATDPQVRAYARTRLNEATRALLAFQRQGVALDRARLDSRSVAIAQRLSHQQGVVFDREYIALHESLRPKLVARR